MQDRITVRMNPDLVARIDEWIGDRPKYVSRQEAVRRLVTFALDQNCPFAIDDIGRESDGRNSNAGFGRQQPL